MEPDLFIKSGFILSYDISGSFGFFGDFLRLSEYNKFGWNESSGFIISGFALIFGFKSESDGTGFKFKSIHINCTVQSAELYCTKVDCTIIYNDKI